LKNNVNVASKSNKQKNLEKNKFSCRLKGRSLTNSRIRIWIRIR